MESHKRSIVKSLSWRVFGVITTGTIVWAMTGKPDFALKIGLIDTVIKLGIFYGHERIWDKINYGRAVCKPDVPDFQI